MNKLSGFAWLELDAFNLIVGAAFRQDRDENFRTYVVTQVLYRSVKSERIGVLCRIVDEFERNTIGPDYKGEPVGKYETFSFDFCDTVRLVGLSVNPDSWDDNNLGQS